MKKLVCIVTAVIVIFVFLSNCGGIGVTDREESVVKKTEEWEEVEVFEKTVHKFAEEYIGNKNTKKFHLPTCSFLPAEVNRIYFERKEYAERYNYIPCYHCLP